ncbi:sulfotransferase domain-containing protein [Jannaschia sp. CCS1]|uniref:sulfotransferase domain-containing protein n=1 Tax=Jannaschia sp. (strain CCS1) TaxID=290400 RepID=UPI0006828736|nr:sulfotransferase domain-containing protein [Jannaschia sp. CCS1]
MNRTTTVSVAAPAPDFFLAGAPKCATSSLHLMLIKHPDVFMCSPKEPHFFCMDLPGLAEVEGRAAYDALFDAAPEGTLRGEASAHYLYSQTAAAEIYAANPKAKIILSLRNPADAARSYFHQLRDGFREDQTRFKNAWNLQQKRAAGQMLPPYCPEPQQLQYRALYSYADQVARYLEIFPPEQIMILRFEDIHRQPEAVVQQVMTFLGLSPPDEAISLPRTNTRRQPRFPRLAQLIAAPPPFLRPLVAPIKRLLNGLGIKPSVLMMRYFSKPAARSAGQGQGDDPADQAFQTDLVAAFEADIIQLEARLAEDFSRWRST